MLQFHVSFSVHGTLGSLIKPQHFDHFSLPQGYISVAKEHLNSQALTRLAKSAGPPLNNVFQHLVELSINLHMLQKRGFRQRLLATSPAIIHFYKIIFCHSHGASGQPGLQNERQT